MAGQCWMRRRPATGGDQDLVGGDGAVLAQKMDHVRVDDHRPRMEGLAAGALDIFLVDRLQPADFAILVGDQCAPVETGFRHRPAIAGGVGEMLRKLRGVDIELFRHAAADDAGAAKTVFLGDANALAECSGNARRPHPAGAAADDEEIVVVSGHDGTPAEGKFKPEVGCEAPKKSPDKAGLSGPEAAMPPEK